MVADWEIYCTDGSRQAIVPDWFCSYLRLGAYLCRTSESDRRLVIAVAAPTRAYAAILTAAGLVVERLRTETRGVNSGDHIEMLRGVEKGTPVVIHAETSKTKGVFVGVRNNFYNGQAYVGVQVAGPGGRDGGLTTWLPPQLARNVAIVEAATGRPRKLPREPRIEELVRNQAFVSHFLPLDAQRLLATKSQAECTIVGPIGLLKREAAETAFAVPRSGYAARRAVLQRTRTWVRETPRLAMGFLQDIVRVDRFCKNEETFRSTIVPSTTMPQVDGNESSVVLFDGAAGYLKWRQCWPKAHFVLFLDRTEAHFVDAVNLINTGFASRDGEDEIHDPAILPPGVEAISYWEAG